MRLLAPLWPSNDAAARDRVIDKVHAATLMDQDLIQELQRLRTLAQQTKAAHAEVWARAQLAAQPQASG